MSGNTGLRQLVPVIIVSVQACNLAGFVSCWDTDKADSSVMKVQEAPCQAAERGIGFLFIYFSVLNT